MYELYRKILVPSVLSAVTLVWISWPDGNILSSLFLLSQVNRVCFLYRWLLASICLPCWLTLKTNLIFLHERKINFSQGQVRGNKTICDQIPLVVRQPYSNRKAALISPNGKGWQRVCQWVPVGYVASFWHPDRDQCKWSCLNVLQVLKLGDSHSEPVL